jgi:hypothetical protein
MVTRKIVINEKRLLMHPLFEPGNYKEAIPNSNVNGCVNARKSAK